MKQSLIGFLGLVLLLSSCQKQMQKKSDLAGFTAPNSAAVFSVLREPVTDICGTPLVTDLVNSSYPPFDEQVKGKLTVSNDGTNLYVTVAATGTGETIGSIQILYGNQALINDVNQYSFDGFFGLNSPTINVSVPEGQTTYTVQIPLAGLNADCVFLNVHALFIKLDEWGHPVHFPVWTKPLVNTAMVLSFPWTAYVQYCKQSCIPQTCGQLRTQTPGGWGAKPAGKNPGSYLYANFAGAFPSGLTVGCASGYTIQLTSAAAVTNLLPSGGKAQPLTMSYVNPTGIKNVLVGHLVALTLSVRFDAYDVNFGGAGITLGAMKISSGAFKGWTVSAFLAEANKVLGGCSSSFTIQQVLDTATAINENYVDGKSDNRFLVCPK
jgi:hypothetical protein